MSSTNTKKVKGVNILIEKKTPIALHKNKNNYNILSKAIIIIVIKNLVDVIKAFAFLRRRIIKLI